MANPTTNLSIVLPVPGGSADTWGTILNDALQSFDNVFAAAGTAVSMQITGGTINGAVIGGTTPAAISGTTLSSSGLATLNSLAVSTTSTFTGAATFSSDVEIDGALNHDGTTVGFYGVTPTVRQSAITSLTLTGTYSSDSANIETAVNSVITRLQTIGITL